MIGKGPMHRSTVLLVGPDKLCRAGLRSLFEGSPFTVIAESTDGDAFGAPAKFDVVPDIALVEMREGAAPVLKVIERLEKVFPDIPVVVLRDTICLGTLAACLGAGASGFLTKDITRDALLRSLELVILGETVFPTHLAGLLAQGIRRRRLAHVSNDGNNGLSEREIEILQCLLMGESNKMIANRLNITEATIKVHIRSVLRKIRVTNRTQAAIWAYSRGYLPAGDAVARIDSPDFQD